MKSNPYLTAEEKGRKKFEEDWNLPEVEVEFAENPTAIYDAELHFADRTAQVEIKYRNVSKDKYDKWLLETKKTESLAKRHENNDHIDDTLYCCYFEDGGRIVWNLADLENPEVQKKWCPKATATDKGHREKTVYMLDPKNSIINE